MNEADNSVKTIGVIGAGTMGRGIVQLFAQGGHRVRVFDAADGAAAQACEFVSGILVRMVEKGRLSEAEQSKIAASMTACKAFSDLSDCDVVVEAVVEDMAVKQSVFKLLEAVVGEHCLLASNTSSLTVSEVASVCTHPQRVAGLHFFNPVPLMKVAEVIAAVRTAPATVTALVSLVEAAGHRAVVAADQPGFLVNHAGRGLYTEGLRILEERVAGVVDVDTVMREALGFKMGPFELLDLTGLDVSGKVMASIYEQFQHEPRFRPSSLIPPRIAAGLFGRKTGEGWYRYENGKKCAPEGLSIPTLAAGIRVWVDPLADAAAALHDVIAQAGAEQVGTQNSSDLMLIQPWGVSASNYCVDNKLDASKVVALDPLPGINAHRTVMLTSTTSTASRDAAHALFAADGSGVSIINDSPGFIAQRVLATIVNIAAELAQRGIASVPDLEDAVRLGLGYPAGPLTLGDRFGASRILLILKNMQEQTGDPRYRPSRWLAHRVGLGLPLITPEALRQ